MQRKDCLNKNLNLIINSVKKETKNKGISKIEVKILFNNKQKLNYYISSKFNLLLKIRNKKK